MKWKSPHPAATVPKRHEYFSQAAVKVQVATLDLCAEELAVVEQFCGDWLSFDDVVKAAAGPRELMGELLVKAGRITSVQLEAALAEQRQTGEKLGEVMVRRQWLTAPELNAVLSFQERTGAVAAQHPGSLLLGRLLVALGSITREQLRQAIDRHRQSKRRIGQVLVDAGYVTDQQIMQGLRLQKVLLSAALTTLLVFSMPPEQAAAAGTARSAFGVSVTVLPHLRAELASQQATLNVSAADVKRGYVDAPNATRLHVRTNIRQPFALNFMPIANVFQRVQILGPAGSVELGADGGTVPQSVVRSDGILDLSYRFYLGPDAQPGTYPWPLSISASLTL